ncbi:MAG: ACT domain-containing protein [Anaerotruncus sp.]|nr:ACT domain-containing protein [Anaerotruncus sp.]
MNGVSKITICEEVALVTFCNIQNDLRLTAEIFSKFAKSGINIDMICQTAPKGQQIDLSFTLSSNRLVDALAVAKKFQETHPGLTPMVSSGNAKIQLYGEEMREMNGVAAAAISALSQTGVELTLVTTSEVDISLLIAQAHLLEAHDALEKTFGVCASYELSSSPKNMNSWQRIEPL